jgi:electron transport complex protein RnfB
VLWSINNSRKLKDMAHRKQGYRFRNDWTANDLQATRRSEGFWKIAKTIPVNIEIMAEHRVLNLQKAKEYLDKNHSFAVLNCVCRMARGNCDAPIDVCICMDSAADLVLSKDDLKDKNPRRITKDEAMQILVRSHEAGLVHMAYDVMGENRINAICSCCSCCCAILSSVLRFGLFPELLTSDTISATDMSKCTGCGICIERCQFGAREMVGDSLTINHKLCMGCGLCVTKCPTTAIRLVAK